MSRQQKNKRNTIDTPSVEDKPASPARQQEASEAPAEIGGPKGPEPTRYGDWEKAGRCIDF